MTSKRYLFQKHFPMVGRIVSLILLLSVIGALIVTYIKRAGSIVTPPPIARAVEKDPNIASIVEGYEFLSRDEKTGKTKVKLIAARDIAYTDGHHELEKLDLTLFDAEGKPGSNIKAERGNYEQKSGLASFQGNVIATNADGLEVKSEKLNFDQHNDIATTDVAVNFVYKEISGSSVGAEVKAKDKTIALHRDAKLTIIQKQGNEPPLELRGQKAFFARQAGTVNFEGDASVTKGQQNGRADKLNGFFTTPPPGQPQKLKLVEARGNARLTLQEPGKASEFQARDMDFVFDEAQRLKVASGWGGAKARSLEKDSPREIIAEKIEVAYVPSAKGSEPARAFTQGRTTIKLAVPEGSTDKNASERILEADNVDTLFHPGGKFLSHAEASGNALLSVTPAVVNETSDKQRLRAGKFITDFFETNNSLKVFVAEETATAEFEPMQKSDKRQKRTLTGRKMTANFDQQTQDITTLTVDDNAKFTEGVRTAIATKAFYNRSASEVQMRGKPQVWDDTLRVYADEIDANTDSGESSARGKVRTTYYSRETTNGAAPFKKPKAPVFIASDRALLKHREGAARYEGNARAWQDDNFVRAATIELDKNEKTMIAVGSVNSALYNVEREIEDKATPVPTQAATLQPATDKAAKRKEIVPIFATADQMHYSDATRIVKYTGNAIIKQGTDRIDAETTELKIDEENKVEKLTGTKNVVLTQPMRRGTGDQIEYTAANDTAILTGNLARVEDREREAVTTGAKLTLFLRDARIQAADEGGSRRVKTTHRIKQK